MTASRKEFFCPCLKVWPCKCLKAREILGTPPDGTPADDDEIVATTSCPECGELVLLEVDPIGVVEWEEPSGVVTEVAPATAQCCAAVFVIQTNGGIERIDLSDR